MAEKVDQMDPDEKIVEIAIERLRVLALELRNYMKLAHPGVSISKPGYLKQRMKLNPDAFLELYKYHNRNFYADSTFSTYKDHLILAADGSDINIPTTAETLKLYGSASRKNTKPQAQIGLGCIYDVMNRMILESDGKLRAVIGLQRSE